MRGGVGKCVGVWGSERGDVARGVGQGFPNFMNVSLKQFQKLTVPPQHKN